MSDILPFSKKELFARIWSTYGEVKNYQYLSKNEYWLFIPVRV